LRVRSCCRLCFEDMCFVVYYELYKNPLVSSPRPMRLECEIARIAGLRVDAVPYPVLSLHPDAGRKQARIWCSDRPAEICLAAMTDSGSGHELRAGLGGLSHPDGIEPALGRDRGARSAPTPVAPNGARLVEQRASDELSAWIAANQLP